MSKPEMRPLLPMYDDFDEMLRSEAETLTAYLKELAAYSTDGEMAECLEDATNWAAELEARVEEMSEPTSRQLTLWLSTEPVRHEEGYFVELWQAEPFCKKMSSTQQDIFCNNV